MRADVKLGVVISVVLVSIAGGYYAFRGEREKPIHVDPSARKSAKLPARAAPKPAANKRSANRNTTPNRSAAGNADKRNAAAPIKSQPVTTKRGSRTNASTPATGQPRAAGSRLAAGATKPSLNSPASTKPGASKKPLGDAGAKGKPTAPPARSPKTLAGASRPGTKGVTLPSSGRRTSTSLAAPVAKTTTNRARLRAGSIDSAVDRHRVQAGDTMAGLAERYYGTSNLGAFLTKSNPQLPNASRLLPGQIVQIPPRPIGVTAKPKASTPSVTRTVPVKKSVKSYRVRSGDSFYKIAGSQLGNSARWQELYDLNKTQVGEDPSRLKVGQLLTLPAK